MRHVTRAAFLLMLTVLILTTSTQIAWAKICPVNSKIAAFLDLAGEVKIPAVSQLANLLTRLNDVCSAVDAYQSCCSGPGAACGSSAGSVQCAEIAGTVGVCSAMHSSALNEVHPLVHAEKAITGAMQISPLYVDPVSCSLPDSGSGTPSDGDLYCCKWDASQTGCHSHLKGGAACPVEVGPMCSCPVAPPGVSAPVCTHYPECNPGGSSSCPECSPPNDSWTPPGRDKHTPTTAEALSWLHRKALQQLETMGTSQNSGQGAANACSSRSLFRLATFQGCRSFRYLMLNTVPYNGDPSTWPQEPLSTDDQDKNYVSLLASNIAFRVLLAVPNAKARLNFAMKRIHEFRESNEAFITMTDAEVELAKWMSPCALQILKDAIPQVWFLMAHPTSTETAMTSPGGAQDDAEALTYKDACVVGEAPIIKSLSAYRESDSKAVTLTLDAEDPEASPTPGAVVIDWGKDKLVGRFVWAKTGSSPDRNTYKLRSADMGDTVTVHLMNSAGKVAEASTKVSLRVEPIRVDPKSRRKGN